MSRESLVLLSAFSLLFVSAPVSAQAPREEGARAREARGRSGSRPWLPAPRPWSRRAKGSFTIRLLPEVAPKHAALFVKTAKAGGYDGTTFHRVIMGGIIQGGDPLTKDPAKASQYGTGGLGLLKAELSDRPFVRGTVAAVRRPSSMDSAGTQFFVCLRRSRRSRASTRSSARSLRAWRSSTRSARPPRTATRRRSGSR